MKKEDEDKGKGKFAMRVLVTTAILSILCLFSVQSVSAIQVSEDVEFRTSDTNTAFIMGKDFNFDKIEVHPTDLMLGDATISVSPSAGSINFTLFNLSTEYWKWNESCSDPGATTDHTMGGLNPNTPYLVKVDGATYGPHTTSDGSGYVSFTYSGGYSDKVFEMEKAQGPKTLYVISDMGQGTKTTTLEAYAISASGTGLNLAGTYTLLYQNAGAVGMALDDKHEKLFVSYENSGSVLVFDATNFNQIATIPSGGDNIAGLVVDTATDTLYIVDRGQMTIYMYDTDTYTSKGTGAITVGAWGLSFDSTNGHLYVTNNTNYITVYDATTFAGVAIYDTGHTAVGIAVDFSDPTKVVIYTCDNSGYPSGNTLTKYETATGTITSVTGLSCPTGVTVDPDTDNAYITTGRCPDSGIEVYNTTTMVQQNRVDLSDSWYPTDLVIGEVKFEEQPEPVPAITLVGMLIGMLGLLGLFIGTGMNRERR